VLGRHAGNVGWHVWKVKPNPARAGSELHTAPFGQPDHMRGALPGASATASSLPYRIADLAQRIWRDGQMRRGPHVGARSPALSTLSTEASFSDCVVTREHGNRKPRPHWIQGDPRPVSVSAGGLQARRCIRRSAGRQMDLTPREMLSAAGELAAVPSLPWSNRA
jgi:hypothetical protein